jgi:hypothetical protein
MVAIDRYRFPHVRTDMAKHNFLYNRHDMTLREPIERVDKERKGPLLSLSVEPPKGSLTVEPAYASWNPDLHYLVWRVRYPF